MADRTNMWDLPAPDAPIDLPPDPPPGTIPDWMDAAPDPEPPPRGGRPRLAASNDSPSDPLILHPARLPSPGTIPPRRWLYGTQLVDGFVTVLVAPGGTGKSIYAMHVATAVASGKAILGEHVFKRTNVAVLNLEDPLDELDRRQAALMLRHHLRDEEIAGRLFLHSGETRKIIMAKHGPDGFAVWHPDEEALIEQIVQNRIGLVVCDPYAESHTLEENNNPQMVAAAAAWRRVARATMCSIMLVHHVRKGQALDIDAARGAKALTDSARVGLLLSPMSADDGEKLGIPKDRRRAYVRLDNAKANLAPRADAAKWFELVEENLGNGTEEYPNGDNVAAMVAWTPPSAFGDATSADLNRALDIIAEPPAGWRYAPYRKSANLVRWAGTPIMECTGRDAEAAARIVKAWLKSGLLTIGTYTDGPQRKERDGVFVNETLRP